jgi:glutaredoxin/transposase-like protein
MQRKLKPKLKLKLKRNNENIPMNFLSPHLKRSKALHPNTVPLLARTVKQAACKQAVYIASVMCALSTMHSIQAQSLYKWVDAQGRVSYSDLPPPTETTVTDLSDTLVITGAGAPQAERLSFETTALVKQSPITLYTSAACNVCEQGRTVLINKGFPYTEKTIHGNEDLKALQSQFKTQSLPVLTVGKTVLNGFSKAQWEEALSTAGYADAHRVPKTYVNGTATPLTVLEKTPTPAPNKPSTASGPSASAQPNAASSNSANNTANTLNSTNSTINTNATRTP